MEEETAIELLATAAEVESLLVVEVCGGGSVVGKSADEAAAGG